MREEGDKMRELEGMRSRREHKGKDNRAGVLEEAGKEGKGGKRMGRRREREGSSPGCRSPLWLLSSDVLISLESKSCRESEKQIKPKTIGW